jgi:hypothetical protein
MLRTSERGDYIYTQAGKYAPPNAPLLGRRRRNSLILRNFQLFSCLVRGICRHFWGSHAVNYRAKRWLSPPPTLLIVSGLPTSGEVLHAVENHRRGR